MSTWVDETDATQLSQRLHVGPRELVVAIGGPWYVVERSPHDEIARPGTLFVGRAGPSVAILVSDDPVPALEIGAARGEWQGPGSLTWSTAEPTVRLQAMGPHATDAQVEGLLSDLGRAVESAFEARRPTLVVCRYCGALVAPEFALGDDLCQHCGARVFGIVY